MNKKLTSVLVLALVIFSVQGFSLFNFSPLTKANGAMCMDGSQYGIYTFNPDQANAVNKLFIYFQDIWQGWCAQDNLNNSISRCYAYTNNSNLIDYGSSNNWGGSLTVLNGIMSGNSIFAGWPKVWIKSCDGGSYFSDASATYKNKTLNFRGSKNVQQVINYMNKNNLLANKEEILIVGIGNGGLAALAWADTIKANTKGRVRVMVDGAIWENDINQKTKTAVFQNRLKMLDKLFLNGKNFPNPKCQQANKDNVAKCFYASELTKHVDPNIQIMFLDSYYDSWEAVQILGIKCSEQFGSLSECTNDHRQAIQDYHKKISATMNDLVKLPNVSAYGIACVAHFLTNGKWDNTDFSVPMNSNNTAESIVQKWLNSKSSTQTFKFLDTVAWPDNVPCSHKVKYSLTQQ